MQLEYQELVALTMKPTASITFGQDRGLEVMILLNGTVVAEGVKGVGHHEAIVPTTPGEQIGGRTTLAGS
jgi:hypothetical protein